MSDIFREVDEALQQEKIERIWKEYRSTIIACIAILVLGTAATTGYRSWDSSRDASETAKLLKALESDKPQEAIQKAIGNTRNAHEALGLLSAASLLIEEDKKEEASALYKQLADNKSAPRDLRDLARIFYVQNSQEKSLDTLKSVLANDKSPWIWHARLEAASLAAHQNENYQQAMAYLEPFKTDASIPPSLKQRAEALLHVYALKQSENKKETE